jgi:deoxycytidine triphosphate deaminase
MSEDFARTDEEARARSEQWKDRDPYPEIPPALLNSAEVFDYVAATGMVHPFRTRMGDDIKLKPASYEIDLFGEYVYWDDDGAKVGGRIRRGDTFKLRRNSITFVSVEPVFRLPDYIAARFNLRIKHVYRGILLGTGPLVDPGFQGPLYIPLHNLTSEDYVLVGGEGLIWMEFTKLNWPPTGRLPTVETEAPARSGEFVPLEPRKIFKDLNYYLEHANTGKPIRSSIPIEVKDASNAAKRAAEEVRKLKFRIPIAAAVGLVIAAIAAGYSAYQLWFQAVQFVNDARNDVRQALARFDNVPARVDSIDRKLDLLEHDIDLSKTKTATQPIAPGQPDAKSNVPPRPRTR